MARVSQGNQALVANQVGSAGVNSRVNRQPDWLKGKTEDDQRKRETAE